MARENSAIHISIVASKSTFNTEAQTVNSFRTLFVVKVGFRNPLIESILKQILKM